MTNRFFSGLFAFLILAASPIFAEVQEIPTEFSVTERWISLTTTFDIETKTDFIGTVHRRIFTWTPQYELQDVNGNRLANARMRFFSFLAVFDVEDGQGKPLGLVQEEFTWFYPSFYILAPDGRKLGEAVLNFWGTKYTVSDPYDGHVIAELTRPFFQLKNYWTVKILDPLAISENNIHPHLFMTLIAFQVDREYWRKQREYERQQQSSIVIYSASKISQPEPKAEDPMAEYKQQLSAYNGLFDGIQPSDEDFAAIAALAESNQTAQGNEGGIVFNETVVKFFAMLADEQLPLSQRAALYQMLHERLNKAE